MTINQLIANNQKLIISLQTQMDNISGFLFNGDIIIDVSTLSEKSKLINELIKLSTQQRDNMIFNVHLRNLKEYHQVNEH